MLTIKTGVAVAILAGAVVASSSITYAVMHFTVLMECQALAPAVGSQPAPNIRPDNGKRY